MLTYIEFHLLLDLFVEDLLLIQFLVSLPVQLVLIRRNLLVVIVQVVRNQLSISLKTFFVSGKSFLKCSTLERIGVLEYSKVVLWSHIVTVKQLLDGGLSYLRLHSGGGEALYALSIILRKVNWILIVSSL